MAAEYSLAFQGNPDETDMKKVTILILAITESL